MADEGAAEKVYEAGIEIVNPGGRPDVLRQAAAGWREMGDNLEETYRALNRRVEALLGEHWRGPAADAFEEHWKKIGDAVKETTPLFTQAADGLDDAAKNIEEINDQIHQIYLEIGVSIGASVALSFVTLGFSAAAGAANAARLGLQAVEAASKLGRLLSLAARAFRAIRTFARAGRWQRLTVELGVQWAAGTGSGVVTSIASRKGPEWGDNIVNGAVGALGGKYIAGPLAGRMGSTLAADIGAGAVAGGASSVVGDTVNTLRNGDQFDASQIALGAVAGGLTGGAGSGAVRRAADGQNFSGAHGLAGDVATNAPIGTGLGVGGNISKGLDAAVNGDANADKDSEKPGGAADARREAGEDARRLREKPDTDRFGAFG